MLDETQQREYEFVSLGFGFVKLSERTVIEITGGDRASFLHNLCTNEVKAIRAGSGGEAFVTNVQGKTIGHILYAVTSDRILIHSVPNQNEFLINHFDRYLITEDVNLADRTGECDVVAIFGATAQDACGDALKPVPSDAYWNKEVEINGLSVLVQSMPLDSWPCLFGIVEHQFLDELVSQLAQHGGQTVSEEVFEVVRIENIFPEFDRDFTDKNLPQEIDRDALAISFTKGCYLGQETVARLDALGHVNKKLTRLKFDGDKLPKQDSQIRDSNGEPVGNVTSVCFSPRFESVIGLGIVRCKSMTDHGLCCGDVPVRILPSSN